MWEMRRIYNDILSTMMLRQSMFTGAVEETMFATVCQSGASWNDTFWSNARFDELLLAARAELDENKRREIYYEMQALD